ncbi:MAG: hypothetical protein ACREBD_27270 [Blastocatellia bacterium]
MGAIRKKIQKTPLSKLVKAGGRLLHPSISGLLLRDRFDLRRTPEPSRRHLDAAIQWICRAHDQCGGQGVAQGFSLLHGWHPPYPETTGYIIPTFYDYALLTGRGEFRERAAQMADWEIEVQMASGAVVGGAWRGPDHKATPVVFNTGQVILGWCRAYVETKDERYLAAAQRAGDWLGSVQSPDGSWRLPGAETETLVHAYDARTAWSLLEIYKLTNDERYLLPARRNLDWTLAQQQENGWFQHNAFFTASQWNMPLTHTISYVMEGLLESWRLISVEKYFQAARKTAEKLLRIFESESFIPGEFDSSWKTSASYSCLTGSAQIAGVWLRMAEITRERHFLDAAVKLNDYVKSTQLLNALHPGIRGGVKGSHPISGRYTPYTYVNWGAKFLADSLMLEEQILESFAQTVQRGEKPEQADLAGAVRIIR